MTLRIIPTLYNYSAGGIRYPIGIFIKPHVILVNFCNTQKNHLAAKAKCRPVAVEAEPVDGAAGAERQRVTCLVDNAGKGVGTGDSGQTVLRTVAPVDQVGEVPLKGERARE